MFTNGEAVRARAALSHEIRVRRLRRSRSVRVRLLRYLFTTSRCYSCPRQAFRPQPDVVIALLPPNVRQPKNTLSSVSCVLPLSYSTVRLARPLVPLHSAFLALSVRDATAVCVCVYINLSFACAFFFFFFLFSIILSYNQQCCCYSHTRARAFTGLLRAYRYRVSKNCGRRRKKNSRDS